MDFLHDVRRILKAGKHDVEIVMSQINKIVRKDGGVNGERDVKPFDFLVQPPCNGIMQLNAKGKAVRFDKFPALCNLFQDVTLLKTNSA